MAINTNPNYSIPEIEMAVKHANDWVMMFRDSCMFPVNYRNNLPSLQDKQIVWQTERLAAMIGYIEKYRGVLSDAMIQLLQNNCRSIFNVWVLAIGEPEITVELDYK